MPKLRSATGLSCTPQTFGRVEVNSRRRYHDPSRHFGDLGAKASPEGVGLHDAILLRLYETLLRWQGGAHRVGEGLSDPVGGRPTVHFLHSCEDVVEWSISMPVISSTNAVAAKSGMSMQLALRHFLKRRQISRGQPELKWEQHILPIGPCSKQRGKDHRRRCYVNDRFWRKADGGVATALRQRGRRHRRP